MINVKVFRMAMCTWLLIYGNDFLTKSQVKNGLMMSSQCFYIFLLLWDQELYNLYNYYSIEDWIPVTLVSASRYEIRSNWIYNFHIFVLLLRDISLSSAIILNKFILCKQRFCVEHVVKLAYCTCNLWAYAEKITWLHFPVGPINTLWALYGTLQ